MTTDDNTSTTSISAQRYAKVLLRGWWAVALSVLTFAAGAFVMSKNQQRLYQSTASILFRQSNIDQQLFGFSSSARSPDADRDAATNLDLVLQPIIGQRAAAQLGTTPIELAQRLRAEPSGASDIVNVIATDSSPSRAARIATIYARTFLAYRREVAQQTIAQAQRRVEAQLSALPRENANSPDRQVLQDRASQLSTLAAVQTGNVELTSAGREARYPVSPNVKRSTATGAFVGLLLGLILISLRARFDQRIRETEEVSLAYNMPLLGEVPDAEEIGDRVSGAPLLGAEADVFRLLRTRLQYFNVDETVRTVLVTSGAPGEGKSTLAWFLARAAAEVDAGSKVLLIEADLRRPTLSLTVGLHRSPGLADVLARGLQVDGVLQKIPVGLDGGSLSFLAAGSAVPSPTQLLNSEKLRGVLETLSARFDFVVIDAAPASFVPDTLPLLSQVDGVIVVARLGASRRNVARRLGDHLRQADAKPLGVVVNGVKQRASAYYAYYGAPDPVSTQLAHGANDEPQDDPRPA